MRDFFIILGLISMPTIVAALSIRNRSSQELPPAGGKNNNQGNNNESSNQGSVVSDSEAVRAQNIRAFLETIQFAEGTTLQADPYRVTFGYEHIIINLNDHPANTGEWTGKILPDQLCLNVGLSPGCKSTAAGAYQFIRPTWNTLKNKLNLSDFSASNQDKAAAELIYEKGALADVYQGRIEEAVLKVSSIWASFPGSTAGQPKRSMSELLNYYESRGGLLDFQIA